MTWGLPYTWIFPIDINAFDTFVLGELREICGEEVAVIDNRSTKDRGAWFFGRISPTTKGDDALDVLQLHKPVPLFVLVSDYDFEGCRIDIGETPVDVRVRSVRVCVLGSEPKAVAIHVP